MKPAAILLLALTGCSRLFALEEVPDPSSIDGDVSDSVVSDGTAQADLIAHYTMDSITGDKLVDAVGGLDGECTSCPNLVAGPFAGALEFNGSSNVVDVLATPAFATPTGMTVSVWVRLETAPGSQSLCAVSLVLGTIDNTWQLCADSGPVINAYFYQGGEKKLSGPSIGEDVWHHVALRWNGTTLAMFVDGAPAASIVARLAFDGGRLAIGGDRDSGVLGWAWDGSLDDLRIYSRALDSAEIAALASD